MRRDERQNVIITESMRDARIVDSGFLKDFGSTATVFTPAHTPHSNPGPKTPTRKLSQREMFPGVKF